jgi:hypothetical protein
MSRTTCALDLPDGAGPVEFEGHGDRRSILTVRDGGEMFHVPTVVKR